MKLEWQSNPSEEPMTWDEAMEYAESLGNGWRLPTRAELIDAYYNNVEGFKDENYWSSTTYTHKTSDAFAVIFSNMYVWNGYAYKNDKTNCLYVRCVKSIKENKKNVLSSRRK